MSYNCSLKISLQDKITLDLFGAFAYNTKHELSHNLFNHSLKLINPIMRKWAHKKGGINSFSPIGMGYLYIYVA
jgi:hypothetical protein